MSTDFLHGVEVITIDSGPRPVQTIRSSVIGLIGTAPDATDAFPVNTPVLVNSRGGMVGLGVTGTLKKALDGIFDQWGALVVVVRVEEGDTDAETVANIIGGEDTDTGALTGVQAFRSAASTLGVSPMLLIAPGFTSDRAQAVTSVAVGTPGTGYTSAPTVAFSGGAGSGAAGVATLTNGVALALNAPGTGYTSAPTVAISAPPAGGVQATATAAVNAGSITGFTVTNPGKGYLTPPTATISGGGGTGGSATVTLTGRVAGVTMTSNGYGYTSAPTVAFTGGGGTAAAATATVAAYKNPVVASMEGLAGQLRAHIIACGPSTTDSDAIAYRNDFGNRRVYIVDPEVSIFDTDNVTVLNEDSAARVAGLIARIDAQVGFWKSPSNEELFGVIGLGRPIDWQLGDPNSRANILNSNQIATVIREDGFRLWGNRTTSEDAKWAFLCVSRTADMIDISIMQAHRWAVDKVINKQYFEDVKNSVNAYLRQLRTRGAVLGGQCWVDPDFNTPADISNGNATFSYDFTAPYPAERVTFRSSITDDYIASIFAAN